MYALLIIISILQSTYQSDVDLSDVKIWGPGLEPQNLVLPARYFFLQTNLSKLNDNISFKVNGLSLDKKRPCRVWSNILNRKDGSYIMRYKLYDSCSYMEINVKYKDIHLAKSPYIIDNIVHPEQCICPKWNVNEWLDNMKCAKLPKQISRDLSQFKTIDFDKLRKKIIDKYNKPQSISLCHYVIFENKVYRTCYGKYVGFKMFMDNILLSMTRKLFLPNMEFFVNLGDWPLVNDISEKYPIMSWCGSTDSFDIIMPTYDITESTLENMGRVMLDMLSVQGNNDRSWDEKEPVAFWRGRDSNAARLKLIEIAKDNPDMFNASLTNFFFYRDQEAKYGPKSEHISFYKFFDYKYQVSIDGTVAAYRFPYLLAGGSLVLKQKSKYYEHFYNDLKPNVHYIPVEKDLSDLLDKLKWAMQNDEEARIIANNARHYSNENLLPKDIYCYHAHLFNEYSKLLVSSVNIIEGMDIVEQPPEAQVCQCGTNTLHKDEL
ncbi:PREDICTED: KDEL motif-containing protein 1-like [Nicrophorus vespilloides]|uniref:KDEL motif-containing protein 1-like n=1 Tax=Nicrophorus vespilloides TaxID=110193 RepID=A0ABM1M9U8_NICVS|nr:PREDICTED: KDEL motif-containing protein 1-like [Nicrophorus vespilloides]